VSVIVGGAFSVGLENVKSIEEELLKIGRQKRARGRHMTHGRGAPC